MTSTAATGTRTRLYLYELGIAWEDVEDGTVKVEAGTTAVYINFEQRAGRSVVALLAPVLVDIDAPAERGWSSFAELRQVQLAAAKRTVTVDYELLGDFLDRDELDVALQAVGDIADTCDDRLKLILGGRMPHVA